MSLLIAEEELGRFLYAYYRGIFPSHMHLGEAFLHYYNIPGMSFLRIEKNDDTSLDIIKDKYTGRLS